MPKKLIGGEAVPQNVNESPRLRYGCIFCRTGQEQAVAQLLQSRYPHIEALSLFQIKYKSTQGMKTTQKQAVFPGYVFFRMRDEDSDLTDIGRMLSVFRILKGATGDWALYGEDERFARWVFDQGGVIGMSTARRIGDRVTMQSGPLKDFEGQIVKIDRRGRGGQVEFRFDDRVWRVWLAFELIE